MGLLEQASSLTMSKLEHHLREADRHVVHGGGQCRLLAFSALVQPLDCWVPAASPGSRHWLLTRSLSAQGCSSCLLGVSCGQHIGGIRLFRATTHLIMIQASTPAIGASIWNTKSGGVESRVAMFCVDRDDWNGRLAAYPSGDTAPEEEPQPSPAMRPHHDQ